MENNHQKSRERLPLSEGSGDGKMRKALEAAQFDVRGKCPVCHGWGMSEAGETQYAHTQDCIVGQALSTPAPSPECCGAYRWNAGDPADIDQTPRCKECPENTPSPIDAAGMRRAAQIVQDYLDECEKKNPPKAIGNNNQEVSPIQFILHCVKNAIEDEIRALPTPAREIDRDSIINAIRFSQDDEDAADAILSLIGGSK